MRLLDWIDRLSAAMAAIASLALLAMTLIVGFEVGSRYLLNSPTIWAWDLNVQLLVLLVLFTLGETFRRNDHVQVDLVTARLSPKGKSWLQLLCAPVLLFTIGVVVWKTWEYAFFAFERGQRASTIFAPLLWPIKFALPVGTAMLFLQVIASVVRNLIVALSPESSERGAP